MSPGGMLFCLLFLSLGEVLHILDLHSHSHSTHDLHDLALAPCLLFFPCSPCLLSYSSLNQSENCRSYFSDCKGETPASLVSDIQANASQTDPERAWSQTQTLFSLLPLQILGCPCAYRSAPASRSGWPGATLQFFSWWSRQCGSPSKSPCLFPSRWSQRNSCSGRGWVHIWCRRTWSLDWWSWSRWMGISEGLIQLPLKVENGGLTSFLSINYYRIFEICLFIL